MKRPASFSGPARRAGSRRHRSAGIALFVVASVCIAIAGACSNQGEGERCEIENGNEDCKTSEGLICYRAEQLTNTDSDRCCPPDRTKATHPICKETVDISGADAFAPADTGPAIPTADAAGADADADATAPDLDAAADADATVDADQ